MFPQGCNDGEPFGHLLVMALLEGTSEIVAGDGEARFEAIYSLCGKPVLSYLLRRLPYEDAKDVAAETFVVVWRRLDEVPDQPLPWVVGVARNQMRNAVRGNKRRRTLSERVRTTMTATGSCGLADHDVDGAADVAEALGAISESDREVLLLVAWEHLDAVQAAAVLGCSSATFRVRLHRARRRLTEQLAKAASLDLTDGDDR